MIIEYPVDVYDPVSSYACKSRYTVYVRIY